MTTIISRCGGFKHRHLHLLFNLHFFLISSSSIFSERAPPFIFRRWSSFLVAGHLHFIDTARRKPTFKNRTYEPTEFTDASPTLRAIMTTNEYVGTIYEYIWTILMDNEQLGVDQGMRECIS